MTEKKQLTVKELLDKLQALLDAGCSPHELIFTDGCDDCIGHASDVAFAGIGCGVTIERSN
jgi:hypothetical protein